MKQFNPFLIVALVIIPSVFGFLRMPTEMGLSIGSIIAALFFVNIEKFERFKGPGIEAELKKAVDKTYAALEELKELSLALSVPIVAELTISGRHLQYIPLKYKLDMVHKIEATLKKLGATDKEIEETCEIIYQRIISDHSRRVLNHLKKANAEKGELFNGFGNWNFDEWNKEKIDRFIAEQSLVVSEETKEAIADLDYFLATKKLRKENNWQS